MARPVRNIFLRPYRSPRIPPVSSRDANARTYPSTIHCSSLTPAPSSRLRVGSATLTTVLSSMAMASAKHMVSRTMTFSRALSPSNPNRLNVPPSGGARRGQRRRGVLVGNLLGSRMIPERPVSVELAVEPDRERHEDHQQPDDPDHRLEHQAFERVDGQLASRSRRSRRRPRTRYRARLHQTVTGLLRATDLQEPAAIPTTGTNAELTNTMGKIHVNDAAWTASTCLIARPMQAEIHENANPPRAPARRRRAPRTVRSGT